MKVPVYIPYFLSIIFKKLAVDIFSFSFEFTSLDLAYKMTARCSYFHTNRKIKAPVGTVNLKIGREGFSANDTLQMPFRLGVCTKTALLTSFVNAR